MAMVADDLAAIGLRHDHGFRQRAAARHHTIDEPISGGILRRQHFAEQQHLHGALARHVARQGHHRRRAEQADIDAGRRKARLHARDRQIASRHELAAGSRRHTFHRGNERLRRAHDGLHHQRAAVHQLAEVGEPAVGIGPPRRHFLHVVPGAERGTVGCDHDCTHIGRGRDAIDRGLQRGQHRLG